MNPMDSSSPLSIATGIVAFVDFGTKLLSRCSEIRQSKDGRPAALSNLETESQELSGNASHARDKIASLQTRYPRQFKSLDRLAKECSSAEKQLQNLVDGLSAKPGQGLKALGTQAFVSVRSLAKQGEIETLGDRLRSIREQTMMSIIMCISYVYSHPRYSFRQGLLHIEVGASIEAFEVFDILDTKYHLWNRDDVAESGATLNNLDDGVVRLVDTLDSIKADFNNASHHRNLPSMPERDVMASRLWISIVAADKAGSDASSSKYSEGRPSIGSNDKICDRILKGLKFEDMMARESHIEDPFPDTFQWLLGNGGTESEQPTNFQRWLESAANESPFWITGNPASGKSTLMKFICTNSRVQEYLHHWSGDLGLLTCGIYLWNPGTIRQKSQLGFLLTLLYQLLRQRPDLCQFVVSKRYVYFQLAGLGAPEPADWTVDELQSCIVLLASKIESTNRLAIFVDGLDEYEGEVSELILLLKRLHQNHGAKLCVSSRPWNVFRDEFNSYPSLRMELLTQPDIEKYVRTRMANNSAFQELRVLDTKSVDTLELEIIKKADGVFLWVVLVVEKLITTARDGDDLRNIWKLYEALPPGLQELYGSIRRRLGPHLLKGASKMYQLLFRWHAILNDTVEAAVFWAAINCDDPAEPQNYPTQEDMEGIMPVLERQLAGHTGGILQVRGAGERSPSIEFIHRTAFDWLRSVRSVIISDGPADYDPSLIFASVLISHGNSPNQWLEVDNIFRFGRVCHNSLESRSKLLRVIERIQVNKISAGDRISAHRLPMSPMSRQPDAALRSHLAIRHACVPYLQASLESSSQIIGLETPRRLLRMTPRFLWNKSEREWWNIMIAAVLEINQRETVEILNMKIRAFEVILRTKFFTHRELTIRIEDQIKRGEWPVEYWKALVAGLRGEGFVELTDVANTKSRLTRAWIETRLWKRPSMKT